MASGPNFTISVSSSRTILGSAMTASSRQGGRHYPRAAPPSSSAARQGGLWHGQQPRRRVSDFALEAVLAGIVDVADQRPLAVAPETQPQIQPMRVLEARVRPELEPSDRLGTAPVNHQAHERLAEPASALSRVEVEAVQLGRASAPPVDAHRP